LLHLNKPVSQSDRSQPLALMTVDNVW